MIAFQVKDYDALVTWYREPSFEHLLDLLESVRPGARKLPLDELPRLMSELHEAKQVYEAWIHQRDNLYLETYAHVHMPSAVPSPSQYTRLQFCRDIWHCTPKEFYEQSLIHYLEDITLLNAETQAANEMRSTGKPSQESLLNG